MSVEEKAYFNKIFARERIVASTDISTLDPDFYTKCRHYLWKIQSDMRELESFKMALNKFVTGRVNKIAKFAVVGMPSDELKHKLTTEELNLFYTICSETMELKDSSFMPLEPPQPLEPLIPNEPFNEPEPSITEPEQPGDIPGEPPHDPIPDEEEPPLPDEEEEQMSLAA